MSKFMGKLWRILTSRMLTIGLIVLAQAIFFSIILYYFSKVFVYWYTLEVIVKILCVISIVNQEMNPSYKIAWMIPICIVPVFGAVVYWLFRQSHVIHNAQRRMDGISKNFSSNIKMEDDKLHELTADAYCQSRYIEDTSNSPVFTNYNSTFYSSGEDFFKPFIEDLKSAENYIFMEFFIMEQGYMLDHTLKILREKVEQGVQVRILYDDVGCITKLPRKYYKELEDMGVLVHVFNRIRFLAMPKHNNRDHRKIVVIDGKIAYTGGLNLADEYINKVHKFGYWKDTAVRVTGPAVTSFVTMFLSLWNFFEEEDLNHEDYFSSFDTTDLPTDGYVQPYNDSPLDTEAIGEEVYMNMMQRAKNYFYITTPYLILSDDMISSLSIAAKSGVDVRIITPGIPDKKLVYIITRSYYETLLKAGIRIYEYTPGFIHAKQCVCDDLYATVGTINMDFRSLYLHFECGVWFYDSHIVGDVKKDMDHIISQSNEISLEHVKHINPLYRRLMSILRIFSPLA